jgi:DNA polymerase phi
VNDDDDLDDLEDDEEEESVDDEEQTSSDEDDIGENEDAQELRRKIEETLKVNGIEAAIGNSDEESDEALMDDDQMMAIDEQLAQVFRLRLNEKKSSQG